MTDGTVCVEVFTPGVPNPGMLGKPGSNWEAGEIQLGQPLPILRPSLDSNNYLEREYFETPQTTPFSLPGIYRLLDQLRPETSEIRIQRTVRMG